MTIIRIVGLSNGEPTPHDGKYVREFHPEEGPVGVGVLKTTFDITRAKVFKDFSEAHRMWTAMDTREPTRPWDGKPNRPMTMWTVEFL
jgi:hypothetical protein